MKKTGAILLAAGLSSRMGDFKPMLPFGSSSVAQHMVQMLETLQVEPIIVVTGYRAEELETHLSSAGVQFIKNERYWETQMFDSIRIGIRAICGMCERCLIIPMDIPAILPDTVRQVMRIDAPIVRTMCRGEPGHPVMVSTETAARLCEYRGEGGLRGAMEHCKIPVTNIEVEDEGIYRDMDTWEEYQQLLVWNFERGQGYPIRPQIQIKLVAAVPFYGPGVQNLMQEISQAGSLREACNRMNLSYSKGAKMVRVLEHQLGFSVIERHAGGSGGGGSRLTEKGQHLLKKYESLVNETQSHLDTAFLKYFGNGL